MKKKAPALASALLLFTASYAQVFERTYGGIDDDMAYHVSICDDGSYLIAGYTTEFYSGYEDVFLMKLDQNGDTLWTRQEGETYGIEQAHCITPVSDGGFIVAGIADGTTGFVPFLSRYDPAGTKIWQQEYNDPYPDGYAWHALQSGDTTFAVCGTYQYSKGGAELWGQNVFVMSVNLAGEVLWNISKGNIGVHYGTSMVRAEDGGLVVGGMFDTPDEFTDAWLFKVSETGSSKWNKTIGGDQSTESAWDIKETPDGGFIMLGNYFQGIVLMNADFYLVKTDGSGNVEWTRTYGLEGEDERGASVDVTNDGGYILCGETESYGAGNEDVWLIRTDPSGDTLWTQTYGGIYGDEGYSVKATADGGFIIAGMTENNTAGGTDIYVIKTNFLGTQVGIDQHISGEVRTTVYPNPVTDEVYLTTDRIPVACRLTAANGTVLKSKAIHLFNPGSPVIRLDGMAPGIYFLFIRYEQGESIHKLYKH